MQEREPQEMLDVPISYILINGLKYLYRNPFKAYVYTT